MKLNLGSGDTVVHEHVSVDLYDPTATIRADVCEIPLDDASVEAMVAYQLIEHVPYNKSIEMFREWFRLLKPGGTVILETPDIDVIARKILEQGLTDDMIYNLVGEYYRPWDKDRYEDWDMCAAAIHRNPWNFQRLEYIAGGAGFKVERSTDQKIMEFEENMRCVLTKPVS